MGKTKLKTCLILGGGEIADYAAVAALLLGDEFVLCADSGLLHCEGLGVRPDLLVGDFDSAGVLPRDVEIMAYPAEKDYTDSTLAVREALRRGYTRILMAGMLGGRFDHSLGNLQNLAFCAANGVDARVTDGRTDIFAVRDGTIRLKPRGNAYFSVFPLVTECGSVTIRGAKYPLDGYPLRCDDPRAVSNEFADGDAEVTVKDGIIAVVVVPK